MQQVGPASKYTSDQHSSPDISLLHPRLRRQWDFAKNAQLGPTQITPHNMRTTHWICDECPFGCPHKWATTVYSRTKDTQSPFCTSRKRCKHNCLATLAPAIAAEFSNKNKGTPHGYTINSANKLHWQCAFGHEWVVVIESRTSGKESGCPSYCNQQKRGKSNLRHPFLTDSQHPMLQRWDWEVDAKAGLDPSRITCRSSKNPHWICLHCPKGQPHRWQAAVGDMYNGTSCSCCSGCKACICNSPHSLAPEVAAEWDHTKNQGSPSDYTIGSAVRKF